MYMCLCVCVCVKYLYKAYSHKKNPKQSYWKKDKDDRDEEKWLLHSLFI